MADKKITELSALETSANDDVLVIVDTSETETKKITKENLLKEIQEDVDERLVYGDYVISIIEKSSGDIDDENVDFNFSQKPTLICINGAFYRENHGWTWSTPTATIAIPVGTGGDIYGII